MRKAIALVIITIVGLVGSAAAEDPVHFLDAKLKAAVENALWLSDPTPTDMQSLTSLTRINADITDLTGLEYATNLQSLNLRLNDFSDLTPLSGLSNLRTLRLTINGISNIAALSGLTDLETLDLHGNKISDVSPLSGLTNLKTLVLHRNQISTVSSLSGLSHLSHLDIQRNQISDISALSGLDNLGTLLLEYNDVSDVSPLTKLSSLKLLDLRENPLSQDSYGSYIPQITANNPGIDVKYDPFTFHTVVITSTTGGSVIVPGEGEFTFGHDECMGITAEADPGFAFSRWCGGYSTTQNPALLVVDHPCEIQAHFVSVLDTLYVDDDAPDDLGPNDATVSDLLENGTWEHPFDSIQETIEVAAEGTSVFVRPGTYSENITLMGRQIQIMGIDPNAPSTTGYPVIDGGDRGAVVSFTRGEDPNCMLVGFILTGGRGHPAGGVLCTGSSPTIANCLIIGNRTSETEGAVVHCRNSQATLIHCTIADNDPGQRGTGLRLVDSNVTLLNSILWENGPSEITESGTSEPAISYTDVAGGWPGLGNIDTDPLFARRGYWADPDDPGLVPGPSNLKAVWIGGDYHLKSQAGRWDPQAQIWIQDVGTSPCIDTADPADPVGREPSPNGNVINMGAYGGSAEASLGR